MQVLQRAGFDPQAMPAFLQKLADQNRYSTAPPEMLQTHPLPLSRLADTRNRANQMKHIAIDSSQDFYLAKARVLGMFGSSDNVLRNDVLDAWQKGNARRQLAAQYGQAILFYQAKKYDDAKRTLQPLLTRQPSNIWLVDLMTDIDLALKQTGQAISRLEALVRGNERDANPVLLLNLANGWDLLAQACAGQGLGDQELAARAAKPRPTAGNAGGAPHWRPG